MNGPPRRRRSSSHDRVGHPLERGRSRRVGVGQPALALAPQADHIVESQRHHARPTPALSWPAAQSVTVGKPRDHVRDARPTRTIPSARASRTIVAGLFSDRCCARRPGVRLRELVHDRALLARPALRVDEVGQSACCTYRPPPRRTARRAARPGRPGPSAPAPGVRAPRPVAACARRGAAVPARWLQVAERADGIPLRPSFDARGLLPAAQTRAAARLATSGTRCGPGTSRVGARAPPRSAAAGCTWRRGRSATARRS